MTGVNQVKISLRGILRCYILNTKKHQMGTLCQGQMQRPAAKISTIQCEAESKLVFPQKHRQEQIKTITLNLSSAS